jgi:cytochrome c-type biogenesis protein CcmH
VNARRISVLPARLVALCFVMLAALAAATPALAVRPDEILPDPKLEHRAREISAELRCLVCQNQSIDDSDAPLARDLRILVRERLKAGDSNAQVKTYLVDRFGEFVLLKPVFAWHTALLWLAPFFVLAAGAAAVLVQARRRRAAPAVAAPLTPEEQAALEKIVGKG